MRVLFLLISFLFAIKLPQTFSAQFIQTIKSDDKKIIYKGSVEVNNEKIFWSYNYPNKKYIWVENKIYIYEPDLEQVSIAEKKTSLKEIIKKAKKIKNNLYLAKIDNTNYYFIYDKTLKKLYYTDKLGNKVEILFFNQSNKIDPSHFQKKFPKDVDYIYLK